MRCHYRKKCKKVNVKGEIGKEEDLRRRQVGGLKPFGVKRRVEEVIGVLPLMMSRRIRSRHLSPYHAHFHWPVCNNSAELVSQSKANKGKMKRERESKN